MLPLILSPLILLLTALANASTTLLLHIPVSQVVPNPWNFPSSATATAHALNITRTARLHRDNAFHFHDLPVGSYLVRVDSKDVVFSPLRVDVTPAGTSTKTEVWQTFLGNEWSNKGMLLGSGGGASAEEGGDVRIVVELRAERPKEYYMDRAGFSPIQFLKNPMILMGVVSLLLVVGLPKLMDSMDDETRAEFEEMQMKNAATKSSAQDSVAQMQNFDIAGWLAGSGTKSSGSDANAGSVRKR